MLNWYPCEMHCHTLHSDGKFTVTELLNTAKEYGLCGIALTDHNTMSGWSDITKKKEEETVAVLKGIEWTTFFGHMLVTDCAEFVDWRDAVPDNIDRKIAEIKKYGGMVGIAHPYELGSPMCTGCFWDYHVTKWENVDYIEAWSKPFPASKSANERAMALWTGLLDKGCHIAATYGKDWHGKVDEIEPSGCTYIGTKSDSLSASEIKKAVQAGRTTVTMGPKITMYATQNGKEFNLGDTLKSGDTEFRICVDESSRRNMWEKFNIKVKYVRLVSNQNQTVFEAKYRGEDAFVKLNANVGWYRAEILGTVEEENYMLGFTSPLYVE